MHEGEDNMEYNYIRKTRLEKGMTLTKLAHLADLSPGYICHLEKGTRKNPSMKVMTKICIALNCELTDIFFI